MALRKLTSLGSYEEINSGAHRKAASIVGTPSLVRRLGFWDIGIASPEAGGDSVSAAAPQKQKAGRKKLPTGKLRQDERSSAFDTYFLQLKRVIEEDKSGKIHFDKESSELQYEYSSDTVAKDSTEPVAKSGSARILRFRWSGMLASVRLEFHSEYITVTSILDLSVRADPRYQPTGKRDFQRTMRLGLARLARLFASQHPKAPKEFEKVARFQEDLWKAFEDKVLNASLDGEPILETAFGEVFVDFRGMVSGTRLRPAGPDSDSDAIAFGFRPPFRSALPRKRDRRMRHEEPPPGWAPAALRALWPLMESAEFFRDYEFTVSGFLKGRALYISALGPQPLGSLNPNWPWTPVYYYIHAYTDDEWQIGRLIDRINTLGTMRLAATMEIAKLFEAGRMVEALAVRIEAVSGSLQEAITKTKPRGQQDARSAAPQDPEQSHEKIVAAADKKMLGIQAALQDIDHIVSGNIAYRLERSQYYLNQWTKEVLELREARIEGYQMYREFVMRRMGEIFGYIDLLRARMGAINSAMSGLGRQYASLKIASVTCSIDGLVASLGEQNEQIKAQNLRIGEQNEQIKAQNVHMDEQHEDMQNQEREIAKIQEFGEIALIGAIIPYYLGTSVIHYLLGLDGLIEAAAWLATLSGFAIWELVRIRKQIKDAQSRSRLQPILYVFVGYLILIWALFALSELPWHDWISRAAAVHSIPAR